MVHDEDGNFDGNSADSADANGNSADNNADAEFEQVDYPFLDNPEGIDEADVNALFAPEEPEEPKPEAPEPKTASRRRKRKTNEAEAPEPEATEPEATVPSDRKRKGTEPKQKRLPKKKRDAKAREDAADDGDSPDAADAADIMANNPLMEMLQRGVRKNPRAATPKRKGKKAVPKRKGKQRRQPRQPPATVPEPAPVPDAVQADESSDEDATVPSIPQADFAPQLPRLMQIQRCAKCSNILPPQVCGGKRLAKKTQATLYCSICNTRSVQVSRVLKAKGLAGDFAGLPKNVKDTFWKSVAKDGSSANILKQVKSTLKSFEEQSTCGHATGDYQPLSWYAKQGYDAERIKRTCDDFYEHVNLGRVYRVEIVGGGSKWMKGISASEDTIGADGDLEGNSVLASGNSASASGSNASSGRNSASVRTDNAKALQSLKSRMADLQKEARKSKETAEKVCVAVSGEISILETLRKGRLFKTLEAQHAAVHQSLMKTFNELKDMKQSCLQSMNSGIQCSADIGSANALVKQSQVQRQFIARIMNESV